MAAEAARREVRASKVPGAHQRERRTPTAALDRSRAVLVLSMEELRGLRWSIGMGHILGDNDVC